MQVLIMLAGMVLSFFVGYKIRDFKTKKVVINEQQKQKYERIKESFSELMNYDYETALGRDKR